MKAKRIFFKLLIFIVISIIFYYLCLRKINANHKKFRPSINSTPKRFIKIYGKINTKLHGQFEIIYQTTTKQCLRTINLFEGVYAPRIKRIRYKINSKTNKYSLKIPLDQIQKGFCKWSILGVNYAMYNSLFNFHSDNLIFYVDSVDNKIAVKQYKPINITCYLPNKLINNFYCDMEATRFDKLLSIKQKKIQINFNLRQKNTSHVLLFNDGKIN